MITTSTRSWPTMADYQESIQAPKICFDEGELRKGKPVVNKLGLPRPICGQFASVYELETRRSRWAIKCFLRNTPDLHSRYAMIAEHLGACELPYFVTFDYLEKGIRVHGEFFPIVRMQWVDGLPLNHYVEKSIGDRAALESLETRWIQLLEDLQTVNVGHGDLQHGNVLVASDGSLRLIDYDGMWVPKLEGQESNELGHPDFQSPLRTSKDFDAEIDQFAGDVIRIALRALARKPDLWAKYNNGDNMLFKRHDYTDPAKAELLADLKKLRDSEINTRLDLLIHTCRGTKPKVRRPFKLKKKHAQTPATSGNVVKAADTATAARRPRMLPPRPGQPGNRVARAIPLQRGPSTPSVAAPAAPVAATPSSGAIPKPAPSPAPPSPVTSPSAPSGPAPTPQQIPVPMQAPRLLLHLFALLPVGWAFYTELLNLLGGHAVASTTILAAGFGLASLLGVMSIVSLVGTGSGHHNVGPFFFGFTAFIILFTMFADLISVGWSHWTGNTPAQCALILSMLSFGTMGLLVEIRSRSVSLGT